MAAIVINSNNETNELLKILAQKLGAEVLDLNEEELEDLAFGKIIESEKTGKKIARDEIFELLKKS